MDVQAELSLCFHTGLIVELVVGWLILFLKCCSTEWIHFREGNSCQNDLRPFWKAYTINGKTIFTAEHYPDRIGVQNTKRGVTTLVSLIKWWKIYQVYPVWINSIFIKGVNHTWAELERYCHGFLWRKTRDRISSLSTSKSLTKQGVMWDLVMRTG